MADNETPPADVMDAATAAIGGVESVLHDLIARVDGLAATQAATLEHLVRLQPVTAAQTEVAGTIAAVDPLAHDPPATAETEQLQAESPLRKFHNVLG